MPLVPIDCLGPGDEFVELSSEPRLDVHFTVESKIGDKIVAIDEFGYKFHFPGSKLVRVNSF